MRSRLALAILAAALSGCSPVAHIEVTVRSASDVSFDVSTGTDDPAYIDDLVVRDSGGVTRWELSRAAGATACVQQLAFPKVPPHFVAQEPATALARGAYQVEVRSGIYRGVADFMID